MGSEGFSIECPNCGRSAKFVKATTDGEAIHECQECGRFMIGLDGDIIPIGNFPYGI